MLSNYLKIALRQFLRRKGSAFINVFGLAVGLTACLLMGLYVDDELSYDLFHEKSDRIYRVLREFDIPDLHATIEHTPAALAEALAGQYTEFERAVRVSSGSPIVERDNLEFVESGFLFVDDGFFDVFTFPIIRGSASLDRPGTLVLSETMAAKYFQDEDPIGEVLNVSGQAMEVTGVMADIPGQSHLQFDFVTPLQIPPERINWGNNDFLTYVLLRDGVSKQVASNQMEIAIAANTPVRTGEGSEFIPHLQPVTGIHFGRGVPVEIGSEGNILYVYLFIVLALFILLLACVNFVNLTTARSMDRAREVGLRKTLGAYRVQLVVQFLGEAVLMSVVAYVLALFLCYFAVPGLNELAGKSITYSISNYGPQLLALLGLVVCVGILTGSYPAFLLSRFQSAETLKGSFVGPQNNRLRKVLVVFQFAISIGILACTAIVLNQLRYMKNAGLGFDPTQLLVVEKANYLGRQVDAFSEELSQIPGVQRVSSGFSMPGTFFINSMWQPVGPGTEARNLDYSFVGFDYIETLGIEMAAGSSFSRRFASDSASVILNEAAAQRFGWTPEDAIGRQITQGSIAYNVIGVAKNFNFRSLHSDIYPLALFAPRRQQRYLAVKLASPDVERIVGDVRSKWAGFTDLPLEYNFLRDALEAKYQAEQRLFNVFVVFSILAMLIACLGLLGLTTYMVEKRKKEIGVRKVLGASVRSVTALLSRDFLLLFAVSFVLASPIAYVAMKRWLQTFAYRIDIQPGIFFLAGALALGIALLTVSYLTIRAARSNPVDSLRYE